MAPIRNMLVGLLTTAVLLAIGSADPAHAFQEVPVDESARHGPPEPPPGISLDYGLAPKQPSAAFKAPRGFLPSLDFGLDLLYSGQSLPAEPPAYTSPDPEMGVLGTIKRRF